MSSNYIIYYPAAKSPVVKKMIKKIDTMPEDYVTIQKDLITCLHYVYSAP